MMRPSLLFYRQTGCIFTVKFKNYLNFDACDLTLSVYPHRASLKNMPSTVGIEPTTFGIPAQSLPGTELRSQVGLSM